MKYLKLYEFFSIEQSDEQKAKVKNANDAYNNRKKLTKEIVDNMNPKCEDVAQNIKDVFLEWVDDGIEFDDVELCVLNPGSHTLSVYYPLGWQTYKRGNPDNGLTDPSYYPSYGSIETDNKISSTITKTGKLYYNVTFGSDILRRAKKIKDVKYTSEIDWDDEDIKHLFDIVKECADDMYHRLNSMYNIKVIESTCYLVEDDVSEPWAKCKPIPEQRTSKICWILEISK